MMYVVDTHPLIWLLDGDPRLSPAARAALSSPTDQQVIAAIVLAEVTRTKDKGKRTNDGE